MIEGLARVAGRGEPLPGLHDPSAKWLMVIGVEGSPAEGFWIEIRTNADNATVKAISENTLWRDVGPWLAPLIRQWNASVTEPVYEDRAAVLGQDGAEVAPARRVVIGSERVAIPPPAEAGWEVIMKLEPELQTWCHTQVLLARLHAMNEMNLGKGGALSGDIPAGLPDRATTDIPTKTNRRARSSSSKRSVST